jgi:L-lactate dehydrogenase complex protein LldE
MAVVKVLEHLGHEVVFPAAQTCCGQPMYNNGFHSEARALARRMIHLFRDYEAVVTPSGSCASMVREHYVPLFPLMSPEREAAQELADRTYEFVEFLTSVLEIDLAPLAPKWNGSTTYHYSCHLRDLGMTDEAVRLMQQVDGLEYTPLPLIEQCCGFGGTFSMTHGHISNLMVQDKVNGIQETGADHVVCNDAGCAMNISGACRRAGTEVNFITLAEILAESLGLLDRKCL